MKKAIARIRALMSSPKNDLIAIATNLEALRAEMHRIQQMPNKVVALIALFQAISPISDTGGFSQTIFSLQEKNYGQLDEIIKALDVLGQHFSNAGRSEYGMNRTKKGQLITAADVFLGDVFGLHTKTATYWLENQNRMEKDPMPNGKTAWWCINDYQAGQFIESHINGILEKVSFLQRSFA